ncbi:PaaD-like zinc ribbon domain-containing protein [Halobellus sp. GM3]|uniref:PaaD-like zinc ribbon domain-containing protein n=1 Tax=Halobellus sp. GM3 TaxID=3458410 RepID=UPI00403D9680
MSSSNVPSAPGAADGGREDGDAAVRGDGGSGADGPEAACPFCGSTDTELESTFGTEISKSQYYCNGCQTVFERIKYDGAMPDTGRERDGAR